MSDEITEDNVHEAFDLLLEQVEALPSPQHDAIKRFVFMFEPVVRECMMTEVESHTDVVNWISAAGGDFVEGKNPPWGLARLPEADDGDDD